MWASGRPALSRADVRLSVKRTPLTAAQPASTSTTSPGKAPTTFATGSAPAGQSPLPR
jgi:hypothetical protein